MGAAVVGRVVATRDIVQGKAPILDKHLNHFADGDVRRIGGQH